METFIFFTKKYPPARVKAENHIKACEQFYADHPDFHLKDLLAIKTARKYNEKTSYWLDSSKPHKKTRNE